MLQRANQGYIGAVQNVLKMTFARTGKRRREMLREIMAPSSTNPTAPDQVLSSSIAYSRDWRPPRSFTMLLSSQNKLQNYLDAGGRIKAQPRIPEKNRWNRPFPQCRVKSILRKWYARHADTLLPPLQEKEWLDIYKAATSSTEPLLRLPKRRPQGTVPVFAEATAHSDLPDASSLVKTSPQAVEPQHSKRVGAILGNPHHLTSRYMRRMLARILKNTPTPLADPDNGKLAMRWEAGIAPRKKPATCTNSQIITLFD